MKKCPTCNRTFTDDALSFCLNDGSALLSAGGGEPQSYDPGATMQYNPGRETNSPPTPPFTPAQFQGQQVQQPSWSPTPPVGGMQGQPPPPKKSKTLFWIIGAIAALVVLVIGGAVLALVLVGMSDSNTNNSNTNNSNTNSNENANNSNADNSNADNSNANTSSTPSKTFVAQDNFSTTGWWVGSNAFGKGEYVNGQYQLTSTSGYIATYGPPTFITQNATTRITARNVTGLAHPSGYGLAVFGEIKGGQLDDYSFLIRTDENPSYRIVLHEAGKETTLVDWTSASQIRSGTSSNQLEVRASSSTLDFYINGQFAKSIDHTAKNPTGAAGVYTSGTSTIAFDDLEIYK